MKINRQIRFKNIPVGGNFVHGEDWYHKISETEALRLWAAARFSPDEAVFKARSQKMQNCSNCEKLEARLAKQKKDYVNLYDTLIEKASKLNQIEADLIQVLDLLESGGCVCGGERETIIKLIKAALEGK